MLGTEWWTRWLKSRSREIDYKQRNNKNYENKVPWCKVLWRKIKEGCRLMERPGSFDSGGCPGRRCRSVAWDWDLMRELEAHVRWWITGAMETSRRFRIGILTVGIGSGVFYPFCKWACEQMWVSSLPCAQKRNHVLKKTPVLDKLKSLAVPKNVPVFLK